MKNRGKELFNKLYQDTQLTETEYKELLEQKGLVFSGINEASNLVEIVEIPTHPHFIASQFHPEFSSRPNRAHALFSEFIHHAIIYSQEKNNNIEEDNKK